MEEQKYQWYLIGYTYNCVNESHGSGVIERGFLVDESDRDITQADLAKITEIAKKKCEADTPYKLKTFFVMSISYLGYMTEKEFKGEEKCP